MSFPRFLVAVAATCVFIPTVLILDAPAVSRQIALGGATLIFLLWMVRGASVTGVQLVVAFGIATLGEVFCSLVWGLYDYRIGTIPLYVPVGHLVFYALAYETAEQAPIRRHERRIVPCVIALGSLYALANVLFARDWWGLLWWWAAAGLILIAPSPLMMASCFVYTAILEILGTSLGNWNWVTHEPVLGIPQANPPSGAGLGYCMLDLTTMLAVEAIRRRVGPNGVSPAPSLTPRSTSS